MTIIPTSMLDIALEYAARGWQLIPLHSPTPNGCSCGKIDCDNEGKHPRYESQLLPHGLKNATNDPGIIQVWWTLWPDANIGVITGAASGFWVLDIDIDGGGDLNLEALLSQYGSLPDTPTVRTGSGGQHILFRHPGYPIKNRTRFAPGLDTRGDGGYIVAAPSLHASGHYYAWQISPDDVDFAPAPDWLLQLVIPPVVAATTVSAAAAATTAALPKRTLHYLAFGAQNGTRNNELYHAAQQFYAAGYSHAEADQKLRPRAQADGLSDAEITRTIASAYQSNRVVGAAAAPGTTVTSQINQAAQTSQANQTAQPQAQQAIPPTKQSTFIANQLAAMGYTFRLNLCTDSVEVNGTTLSDVMKAHILIDCRDAGVRPLSAIEDVWMVEASKNSYHPIKEYFDGLVWDGQPHIARFSQYLTCDDPILQYPDGEQRTLFHAYLYRWMIGAIARIYRQAQNMMLVLAGPQDIGKSSVARWLASGIGDHQYFIEGPIHSNDKDFLIRMITALIWEVAEVDATTRRSDVSALKDLLTRRDITVRKPYGRYDITKPVTVSYIGTLNPSTGFLSDETGNRRFMTTTISAIDHRYQQDIDVNQLWAEAKVAYDRGEPWRLQPVEAAAQVEQNKLHEVESTLEGHILKHFIIGGQALGARMTAGDIVEHLMHQGVNLGGSSGRAQAMEISRVLSRLGVGKIRVDNVRYYEGILAK